MIETRAVEGLVPVEATDEGATLESLYRTHAKRIYSLAYRFAGNAADAEELLQDIFLLAYRKLDSFRHEAALSTWLHRLAVNRCLDHVRSRAARQDAATEPLNAEAPPTARADAGPITHIDLQRAIAQLPDGCRMAFVLHDIEGYGHREVAERLGIATGTSKSQVHKARLRLRRLLRRP
jgi:RNA polymerase sigma-70 factor (ECF subfamily)